MWMVVGLGNPGSKYERTRHNIGFWTVDELARSLGVEILMPRFRGLTAEAQLGTEKVLFLKPQTYMNLSGESVQAAQRFYQVTVDRLIVLHDELDLPFGRLRVKAGGGVAGHNGLRSILACLGEPGFLRIRMGIGRPSATQDGADFVLSPFSVHERAVLPTFVEGGAAALRAVIETGLAPAMQRYNSEPFVPGTTVPQSG